MYIDYSAWESFEYTLNTLQLDTDNPRIRYSYKDLNQTQIMQLLLENEKVYELAKKISEEGYFVGEEPIICLENNKKIVLEGNRRTAALKLLQDPKKYLSKQKANTLLKNIEKNNFPINRKLKCYIAPNRLLANPIIYERHNGATLQRWKTGNQYSFVAEMYYEDGLTIVDICELLNEKKSKILKQLKAYNLFYEGQEYLTKEGIQIDIAQFDFTNLERFYIYDPGKEFLGIYFDEDDGELTITLPEEEFEKRIKHIFKAIIDAERFSREFNKEKDKKEYIQKLNNNPSFDFTVSKSKTTKSKSSEKKTDLEVEKSKVTTRSNKKRKTPVRKQDETLFGKDLFLQEGPTNDLYHSILKIYKMNKDDTNMYPIIAMSIRLILEVAAREENPSLGNDSVYKDYLKDAKKNLLNKDAENYVSLADNWLSGGLNFEGLIGKYAHASIIVDKKQILETSKIAGVILQNKLGIEE